MTATTIQPSFTAGELATAMHARIDLEHYGIGLKICRNWFVHAHGGVSNRPGTEYIAPVKDSSKAVRIIEFEFNTEQTYVLEVGEGYIRFIKDGGQILLPSTPAGWVTATAYTQGDHSANGGTNYYCHAAHTSSATDEPGVGANWADYWHALEGSIVEIPTDYLEAELFDIGYNQSADTLTLTHAKHPVHELTRTDHHVWLLNELSLGASMEAPTGVAAAPTGTHATYVVTSYSFDTGEESLASSTASGDDPATADVDITWTAVTDADEYYIYKSDNGGVHGYIGTSTTTSFTDTNIAPEYDDTPPTSRTLFSGSGNYPEVSTYHQQRLCLAQSEDKPQTIWMSQTGLYKNFNVSSPTKDNDSLSFTLAARQVNEIRHLVPLSDLIVLTSGGEWVAKGTDSSVITPTSISLEPQGYRGAAKLRPIISGNIVLYVQARGSYVRSLTYKLEDDGYSGDDLSVRAPHLFEGYTLVDWGYSQIPHTIVWAVRSDGTLLGLTYMLEQNVWGWHRHDTGNGAFESVATIAEGTEDATYFVVNRTINGTTVRYIERLHSRAFADIEDAFFVDCGLSYSGAATNSVSGLDHLEGETVSALADGNAYTGLTVSGGSVSLPSNATASTIHVGLPIEADVETLSPEVSQKFLSQGRRKRVVSLTMRVEKTRGLWVGPDSDKLTEVKPKAPAKYGDPFQVRTADIKIALRAKWDRVGNLFIRQTDPLPATVLAVMPEVDIGGA